MAYRERDNPIPAKIPNRRSSFSGKAILPLVLILILILICLRQQTTNKIIIQIKIKIKIRTFAVPLTAKTR